VKSIKDLLPDKKLQTLIHICQIFGLRGYTKLRKEGIINLISENFKNPQFQDSIRFLIPDNGTVALIFKSFIDNNNEITYKDLRKEVTQKRSGSTFRDNYRALMAKYILFEDEKSESDIHYLPEEYMNIAKEIIEKRIKEEPEPELEPEPEEVEEIKEKKTITTIDQLLYSKKYTSASRLQRELMTRNLKISGTKDQLIERLLYESGEDVNDILDLLFGKVELKDICREFELPVSGTKDDLIKRILDKLPPAHPERIAIKEEKVKIEVKPIKEEVDTLASGQIELTTETIIEEPKVEIKVDLKKEIFDLLDIYKLDYRTITNKENFQGQVFSLLQNLRYFNPKKFGDSKVERNPREPIILIEQGDQNIAVYVFYFDRNKKIATTTLKGRFVQNAVTYKHRYTKDLITYVYDPVERLDIEDQEIYAKEYHLIYKNEKDFKDL